MPRSPAMAEAHPPHFPLHPPSPSSLTSNSFLPIVGGEHDDSLFPHRNTYDLNSKIMLAAIVSLSFVVVLVILLHLYVRCILRRQSRQRALIRSLGLPIADAHNHSGEPPKTGLDPAVIASLPMFVYKQTGNDENDDSSSKECAVCLSVLEDQEMARLLPNCNHTFHAECIDKWLSSHPTCPICRTEAEPKIQPVTREGPAGVAATAPPLERVNSTLTVCVEGTSDGVNQSSSNKAAGGSISRLSSFRRILSRERSSRRLQSEVQEGFQDLERQ
ncbi:E3 ubiquitin-protein ligase ATL41 [Hevea brasiliensis]|uniref:E3 ubiquitin-protein ligase ATL41 n=1 Tax=Hevea brasiliensis TaxID=3981 RepID=UPI0025E1F68C|nr:E3 ubiquitin-protein ligase ATL41 [Hevea brasiliensis]